MSRSPLSYFFVLAAALLFASGFASTAEAAGSVAQIGGMGARAKSIAPMSMEWRRQYMFRHGMTNHVGVPGIYPSVVSGKYLYVADYGLSVIFIYDATSTSNPSPLGFIVDSVSYPAALAFDRHNNLYVANEGTDTITVYAPGSTKLARTISTIFPLGMAFGPDGALYVAGNGNNTNEIEVFPAKGGKPSTFAAPFGDQPGGITVSPSNVVTLTVNSGNQNGYLFTYPNGIAKSAVQKASNIGQFEGVAYDAAGNVDVSGFTENTVYVYTPDFSSYRSITNGVGRPIGLTVNAFAIYVANSAVPSVTAYTAVNASPIVFNQDETFVTAVALTDRMLTESALYVTQECNCSEVDRYTTNVKKPRQVAAYGRGVQHPNGIWVDDAGNLWAANYANNSHLVTELSAATHEPIRFLSAGLNKPYAVSVDHQGTVYVTDQGNANVAVYPAGSSTPSRTLNDCTDRLPQYTTVDAANNLYLACGNDVIKYAVGSSTAQFLGLSNLTYAFGVAIDRAGNLYVGDLNNNLINVYAPGKTTPSRVITAGLSNPDQIAIGISGRLYATNVSGTGLAIYAPGGSSPIGTIPGYFQGVATGL